jgi:hypothetical protein
MCRPKHVEQLRNIGIINSTTRSHLVGSFCKIYVTTHGSLHEHVAAVFLSDKVVFYCKFLYVYQLLEIHRDANLKITEH